MNNRNHPYQRFDNNNYYNKRNDNKSNLDPKNDFSELDIDTVGLNKRPSTVAKTIKNKKNNK
jgi:hypothetical protein